MVARVPEKQEKAPAKLSRGIVFVDDNPSIIEGARRASTLVGMKEGSNIHFFSDAHKALEHMQQHGAAELWTDLEMPRMNGLELIREAKKEQPDLDVTIHTTAAQAVKDHDFAKAALKELGVPLKKVVGKDELHELFGLGDEHAALFVTDEIGLIRHAIKSDPKKKVLIFNIQQGVSAAEVDKLLKGADLIQHGSTDIFPIIEHAQGKMVIHSEHQTLSEAFKKVISTLGEPDKVVTTDKIAHAKKELADADVLLVLLSDQMVAKHSDSVKRHNLKNLLMAAGFRGQ